jgi:hypothetical protein
MTSGKEATASLATFRSDQPHLRELPMNRLKLIVGLSASLLLQAQAFAGSSANNTVTAGSTYGYGALRAARLSADSTQEIACVVEGPNTGSQYIECDATDAAGHYGWCYASAPPQAWINMLSALNESSWLEFVGDSDHHCTYIVVSADSANL